MSDETIYQICGWDQYYENNRTRPIENLKYVKLPNKFDGDRVTELILRGGDGVYAAWVAAVAIASRCNPRGVLVRPFGGGHTPESMSQRTGITTTSFASMLQIALDIGLIEPSPRTSLDRHPERHLGDGKSCTIPNQTILNLTKPNQTKGDGGGGVSKPSGAGGGGGSDVGGHANTLVIDAMLKAAGVDGGKSLAIARRRDVTPSMVKQVIEDVRGDTSVNNPGACIAFRLNKTNGSKRT